MSLTYGVISITALVLLGACIIVDRKKRTGCGCYLHQSLLQTLGIFCYLCQKRLNLHYCPTGLCMLAMSFFPFLC